MARTLQEILDHADELANRLEHAEPGTVLDEDPAAVADARRAIALSALVERVRENARIQRELAADVRSARDAGVSWAAIGETLGTTGEAARQRFAKLAAS